MEQLLFALVGVPLLSLLVGYVYGRNQIDPFGPYVGHYRTPEN